MRDLICKCSHKFSKHLIISGSYIVCQGCWNSDIDNKFICENFKSDNLKYLESILQQKENQNV